MCSLTQKQTRLYHFFFGDPAWFLIFLILKIGEKTTSY